MLCDHQFDVHWAYDMEDGIVGAIECCLCHEMWEIGKPAPVNPDKEEPE